LLLEGYDPYQTGVSVLPGWFTFGADPMWGETPTPYGPFFLLLARGVADFSGTQAYLGAIMFRLIAVLGLMLMVWAVPKLARQHVISEAKALWLAVANPLVIMHFVAGAHHDALWSACSGRAGSLRSGYACQCRLDRARGIGQTDRPAGAAVRGAHPIGHGVDIRAGGRGSWSQWPRWLRSP
jgi:hypothetical protein